MTQLTPTEIESLRIAIAEECGWTHCAQSGDKLGVSSYWYAPKSTVPAGWKEPHPSSFRSHLPPYTTSIDAIQAAAMERFNSPIPAEKFEDELLNVYEESNFDKPWQLTALDWCIAFARTAKIWRYKE